VDGGPLSGSAAPRVLIISHDVVGSRMAGPGIRAWHMAQVLAARQAVTLVAPRPIDLAPAEFRCGAYAWGDAASLAGWLGGADVVVANGFVLEAHPELATIAQPLALDLYDPVLLENLELLRAAPAEQRVERARHDQALLARQLAAGDFFVCATERQRDLYLGALMLAGRLTPALADDDPLARALIDVAPFGLPSAPPARQAPALRGVLDGIGADDPLLLWTGGLWDWLDPLTLLEAMPLVAQRFPRARLVFLAGKHPGTAGEMRMPDQARERAAALGLLGRSVFFYDEWVPYERRADFLLEATVAVSLHRAHLETAYAAVRSRFLDPLWAGLPSVVAGGDAAAELVARHDLGLVVPPGDAAATAAALGEALGDPARLARWSANAHALAREFTWERALAPLARWAMAPRKREADPMGEQAPDNQARTEPAAPQFGELAELIRQVETLWNLAPAASGAGTRSHPKDIARAAVRQVSAPVFGQQTQFNAVVVRALYWLMTEAQRAETERATLQAAIWALERQILDTGISLEHKARVAVAGLSELNERLAEAERSSTVLAQELGRIQMETDS
jgi:glycosyltransferase involved in cell wall biosynthesis